MTQTSERPGAADSGPIRRQSFEGARIEAAPSLQGGTVTGYGSALSEQHAAMLAASKIPAEHAYARGYRSIDGNNRKVLAEIGIVKAARTDGLLIPLRRLDGSIGGYQHRPDNPRVKDGREIKYETPYRQPNMIDFPPGVAERLADRSMPIWITEGVKKVDSGFSAGLAIVGLTGVWNWLKDGAALPDFRDLALRDRELILGFDSDFAVKPEVWKAVRDLGEWLKISRHADVKYCCLPHDGDGKTGLDDYLAAGHAVAPPGFCWSWPTRDVSAATSASGRTCNAGWLARSIG